MVGPGNRDELYDVSDSTDWLNTALASLVPIDASLRCQVCKDFYKTPMITSCSHTFCSLCIRRCLANDGKCPACRTTEQENKLRSNWAIEGLVDEFIKARPALLDASRKHLRTIGPLSPKRKVNEAELDGQSPDQSRKKTRASSRLSAKSQDRSDVVVLDADTDDDYCQSENDLAACPVCGTRMKLDAIDSHLNRCLIESSSARSALVSGPNDLQSGSTSSVQVPSKKLDRLPQLNYSLFKDTALRKKLQELGVSAQGSRPLLERRHTEWVTLWNANCDASRPRKKIDLLRELDVWERTQGARVPSSNSGINPASQILHKDFDGTGWAAKHDLSFQNLIASARKNLVGSTSQPAQTSDTSAGDETSSEALDTPFMHPPKGVAANAVTNDQCPNLLHQTTRNDNE